MGVWGNDVLACLDAMKEEARQLVFGGVERNHLRGLIFVIVVVAAPT